MAKTTTTTAKTPDTPVEQAHSPLSPASSVMGHDNSAEMSSGLQQQPQHQEQSPLELTTGGSAARCSPGASSNEPPSGGDSVNGASDLLDDQQQQHQSPYHNQQQQPPQQKLFDLNQLTEEEKIVLSASGSARLYQASSQDEIDAIMQQVLDSKTTDTILIVSPVGRQIVTCNENGDKIITRVMTTDHQSEEVRPEHQMNFHGEDGSPGSHNRMGESILDYSGQHAIERQAMYENGGSATGHLSPSHGGIIYEKPLTGGQMEILHEQNMRKAAADEQVLYAVQEQQSQLVYDSNNNADNDPHDQMEGGQILKNGVGGEGAEVIATVVDDKSRIDLIYNEVAPPAATLVEEGHAKAVGIYATSGAGMETFIEGPGQLAVPQNALSFEGAAGGQGVSSMYVVQTVVDEDQAMDLQSGLR